MVLPRWIPFAIAAWVIAFGIMRLRIATKKEEEPGSSRPNYRKGGYYGRSKRSHAIYGVAYLLLGFYCIAMGFGYQIDFVGSCGGPQKSAKTPPAMQGGVPAEVAPSAHAPEKK